MARNLTLNAESKKIRETAEDLLRQREKAKQDMVSINLKLKEALDAATKANRDADRVALAAGLAGGASQILSGINSGSSGSQPSSATIELLKQRVDVETNLSTNATIIKSSAQRRSYTIWANQPD